MANKILSAATASTNDIAGYAEAEHSFSEGVSGFLGANKIKNERKESQRTALADINRYKARTTMTKHWHAIENRLAHAFADEIVSCCAAENPRAFLAETNHLRSVEEVREYVMALLDIPTIEKTPPYLSRQTSMGMPVATSTSATNAVDSEPRGSKTHKDVYKANHTAINPSTLSGIPTLTLADTVNGIWAETTMPRLKQPSEPQQLPHIFSIISEMLGGQHRLSASPHADQPTHAAPEARVSEVKHTAVLTAGGSVQLGK